MSKEKDLEVIDEPETMQEFSPSPVHNSNDPLFWSSAKKHIYLAIVSVVAFLPDFGSSLGIPLLAQQTKQWHAPPAVVQHNLSAIIATVGGGGIFVISFAAYFGRLPTMVYCLIIGFATCIWCAEATSLGSYIAARSINGFFETVAQAGGLMWIQDMFHQKDHARKINVFEAVIIVSPYFGPLIASFVAYRLSWRWAYWIFTILTGVTLLAVLFFLDETYYPRRTAYRKRIDYQPKSRILRIIGIEQRRSGLIESTAWEAIKRPWAAIFKLPILLLTVQYFLNFAWVIGVNATVGLWLEEYYKFSLKNSGFFYFAGLVGVAIGWLMGHWLYDALDRFLSRRAGGGPIKPELRLSPSYPAALIEFIALVLLGFALGRKWHYMVVAVCYGLQVVGMLVMTVSVNAYLLQCYPEAPGEVGLWVNMARSFGGFMSTFIQIEWVERSGPEKVLGVEGAIVVASLVIVAVVQVCGERLRMWQGPIVFSR